MHVKEVNAEDFYDRFSDCYYLISRDWWADVRMEGVFYDDLFRDLEPKRILDVSCGPGTQAIGLAARGYQVHGCDISAGLLREAETNAVDVGVNLPLVKADMCNLGLIDSGEFDVVLSAGNAIPHLRNRDQIRAALYQMVANVRRGGWLVLGLRDYEDVLNKKPRFDLRRIHDTRMGRKMLVDLWDYMDNKHLLFHLFILTESRGQWEHVEHIVTQLFMVTRDEVIQLMLNVGLADIYIVDHRWGLVFVGRRQ